MRHYSLNNGILTFVKYTFVGIIGLILDMIALYIFVEYALIPILIASAMAFFISVVNNFLWHKYWTFKDKSHHFKKQFLSFFIIALSNLGITILCMYFFVDFMEIWYMISKGITAAIVLAWSYTANCLFTFKVKK